MEIICHRINNHKQLESISKNFGAEIDVRYHQNKLVLHHDPFNHHKDRSISTLEEFLEAWERSSTLILNIKSEGIEQKCIELLEKYKIQRWFFLDLSMPYFVKYAEYIAEKKYKSFTRKNLAVRFSDKECFEYANNFFKNAGWIWIDYFEDHPLNLKNYKMIKNSNVKICLVSPELHGRDKADAYDLALNIKKSFEIDAVCTKYPEIWMIK